MVQMWSKIDIIYMWEMNLGDAMALLTAFVSCILMLVSKILTSVVFLHVVVTRYQQRGTWTSMPDQNYLWTSLNTLFQLHVAHGWESSPEKNACEQRKIAIWTIWLNINATLVPPFQFSKNNIYEHNKKCKQDLLWCWYCSQDWY